MLLDDLISFGRKCHPTSSLLWIMKLLFHKKKIPPNTGERERERTQSLKHFLMMIYHGCSYTIVDLVKKKIIEMFSGYLHCKYIKNDICYTRFDWCWCCWKSMRIWNTILRRIFNLIINFFLFSGLSASVVLVGQRNRRLVNGNDILVPGQKNGKSASKWRVQHCRWKNGFVQFPCHLVALLNSKNHCELCKDYW